MRATLTTNKAVANQTPSQGVIVACGHGEAITIAGTAPAARRKAPAAKSYAPPPLSSQGKAAQMRSLVLCDGVGTLAR